MTAHNWAVQKTVGYRTGLNNLSRAASRQHGVFINPFIYCYDEAWLLNTFFERKEGRVALVGLVRVSTKDQETARQHDALGPICVRVFEEKRSGKLKIDERPGLRAALDYMRPGDMLTVQEADRLGRNLLEGLIVLNDLFSRGIAVKILEGIAAGEHTERNLILDMALALAEDRRRDIVRKTRNGLDAARARGRVGGRPPVVDADKRRIILARHAEGESIRTIARAVKLSVGTVHNVLAVDRAATD